MNKKAVFGVSGPMVDFIAYGAFMLVLIIFYFIFKAGLGDIENKQIEKGFSNADGNQFLSKYLASSINYNGESMSVVEAISLNYELGYLNNYELKQNLILNLKESLNKFSDKCQVSGIFRVDDDNKNFIPDIRFSPEKSSSSAVCSSKLEIPTRSGKKLYVSLGVCS